MQQLNSIDRDFISAFQQGKQQGVHQGKTHSLQQIANEAEIFAEQFGTQLAKYQSFMKVLLQQRQNQILLKQKVTSKVESMIAELNGKIRQITQYLDNYNDKLSQQNHKNQFSLQMLKYQRQELAKSFNVKISQSKIILSLMGMRTYGSATIEIKSKHKKKQEKKLQNQHQHQHQQDCQF